MQLERVTWESRLASLVQSGGDMRLPRARFTLPWMMLAVAGVATILGASFELHAATIVSWTWQSNTRPEFALLAWTEELRTGAGRIAYTSACTTS